MSTPFVRHVNVDGTIGATFLGLIASSMLYGVVCVQTLLYFCVSQGVWKLASFMVASILALNTAQICNIISGEYHWIIGNFGSTASFGMPSGSMAAVLVTAGLTDLIVRCYLARRISQQYGRSRTEVELFSFFIIAKSCFTYAMTLVYVGKVYKSIPEPSWIEVVARQKASYWIQNTANVTGALTDCLIAASLCYCIHEERTRLGFKESESPVMFLLNYVVSTGLLTSIVAVFCTIVYAVAPDVLVALSLSYILCQLHAISVLVTLNARIARKTHQSASTLSAMSISFNHGLNLSTDSEGTHLDKFPDT